MYMQGVLLIGSCTYRQLYNVHARSFTYRQLYIQQLYIYAVDTTGSCIYVQSVVHKGSCTYRQLYIRSAAHRQLRIPAAVHTSRFQRQIPDASIPEAQTIHWLLYTYNENCWLTELIMKTVVQTEPPKADVLYKCRKVLSVNIKYDKQYCSKVNKSFDTYLLKKGPT
jgi:hypothetical protein